MVKQVINKGAVKNDGTGDSLRDAATKINDNFTELYNAQASMEEITNDVMSKDSVTNDVTLTSQNDLIVKPAGDIVLASEEASARVLVRERTVFQKMVEITPHTNSDTEEWYIPTCLKTSFYDNRFVNPETDNTYDFSFPLYSDTDYDDADTETWELKRLSMHGGVITIHNSANASGTTPAESATYQIHFHYDAVTDTYLTDISHHSLGNTNAIPTSADLQEMTVNGVKGVYLNVTYPAASGSQRRFISRGWVEWIGAL